MADILAIVAHPDDESFSAGGYLALAIRNGRAAHVVAMTDGVLSRDVSRHAVLQRGEHFTAACRVLGCSSELREVFPDQQSDTVPQLTINKAVEQVIAQHRPKLVLTHHIGDLNLDHRRVAEAVFVATRGQSMRVECMSPEWPSRCVGPAWHPTIAVDIGPVLETKVAACLCYVDELRPWPHPRSEQAIRAQTVERFMEVR